MEKAVEASECALVPKTVPSFAWRTDEHDEETSQCSRSLVRDLQRTTARRRDGSAVHSNATFSTISLQGNATTICSVAREAAKACIISSTVHH